MKVGKLAEFKLRKNTEFFKIAEYQIVLYSIDRINTFKLNNSRYEYLVWNGRSYDVRKICLFIGIYVRKIGKLMDN